MGWNGGTFSGAAFQTSDGENCAPAFSAGDDVAGFAGVVSAGMSASGDISEPASKPDPIGRKLDLPSSRPGAGRSPDFSEKEGKPDPRESKPGDGRNPEPSGGFIGDGRNPEPSGGIANPGKSFWCDCAS